MQRDEAAPSSREDAPVEADAAQAGERLDQGERPDLSVVIVNHNVRDLLLSCLLSLRDAQRELSLELLVVDNASEDDSVAQLRQHFPDLTLIVNQENVGFARANNQALAQARGRHLMLLNPDTLVPTGSLKALVEQLDAHPEAGAVGPKVLDPDGSFQTTSKRGLPTPWVAFCRLSGLSRLFPRSRRFNRYELGWLDPDEEQHEIEALYGAAMLVRREAWEQAGGLDEAYFMYGEDIAWSDAIRRAGWELHYQPAAKIIHIKGESTRRSKIRRDLHFFQAMRIFARTRLQLSWWARRAVDAGVGIALALAALRRNASWWGPMLLDGLLLWAFLRGAEELAAWLGTPETMLLPPWGAALAGVLLAGVAGLYGRRRGSRRLLAALVGGTVLLSVLAGYAVGSPKISFLFASLLAAAGSWLFLWGWRRLVAPRPRHVLIVPGSEQGDHPVARRLAQVLEERGESVELCEGERECSQNVRKRVRSLRLRRKQVVVVFSLDGHPLAELLPQLEQRPLRAATVSYIDESLLWDGLAQSEGTERETEEAGR